MIKKVFTFIIKKKWLVISFIILIVISFIYYKNAQAKKKSNYKTSIAEVKDLTETINASGKVKADEEVELKFQTSGQLAWVGVKKGDYVQKWQAIASLDRKELEKDLKQELLDYMNERMDFEQTTVDDYKDKVLSETIERIKDKAQFDLNRVVLDVEIADIALKYSTLITPIEGIVTEIDFPYAGVNVTAATAKFVISNPKKMVFKAKVDEADIGKIKINQVAKISLDAYTEETIDSQVLKIDFTSTTTSGGGTAYEVTFDLPETQEAEKYKIGMNGDTDIIISERKNVLVVPVEAIREKDGENYVWLSLDKPTRQMVKIGFEVESHTQILEGLKENDQVITSDFANLEKKSKKST